MYSQCLRLRRIINCDQRLCERIDELKEYCFNSNYPKKIVDKIANKGKGMERILRKTANTSNSSMLVPESPARNPTIRVISTYGSDGDLVSVVRRAEAFYKFYSAQDASPSHPGKVLLFHPNHSSHLKHYSDLLRRLAHHLGKSSSM